MATPTQSFDVPYRDNVVDRSGLLSTSWASFFRSLYDRVFPLGVERTSQLENNQSSAADIEGMKVNARSLSQAVVEYLVQRVTAGDDAVELIESGLFILSYRPTDEDWGLSVVSEEQPDDAGIEFTVTSSGQVQYTTSDIAGDASLSRIVWRMRTMAGKSAQYSSQGARS